MPQDDQQARLRRVVVADDHAIVRSATRQILADLPAVDVVAEAGNGIEAIAAVKKHHPHLLVLDAAMPLARGVEVFADARRWSPDTKVALLTGFNAPGVLADWLSAGVDGLLLKSDPPEELRACFEALLSGANFVSSAVAAALKGVGPRPDLTHREREVLALIATGNANAAIADRLAISPKTVEKHRASLMAKLQVHSVAELLVYALKEGLLDEHRQL